MGRDRLVVGAFVLTAVLAGGNGVGVRYSNRELDPLWGASLRFSLAAVVLVGIAAALKLELPRGRALTGSLVFGLLNFAAAFGLAYFALVELHAGFGQIVLAVVPLLTLLIAVSERQESLRIAAAFGTLLALGGVVVMSREPLRDELPVGYLLAALGSALCLAQAAVAVRHFPPVHPVMHNAVAMTAGSLVLVVLSLGTGEEAALPDRGETWAALAFLVLVGSVAVFGLYIFLLGEWQASRVAYMFVLIPFVTVALSAWLDDEPVGLDLAAGGALVIAGVYIGALREREDTGHT